jgi:hypothetical protein
MAHTDIINANAEKCEHRLAVTDPIPARSGFREPDEGQGMSGRLRLA